MKAARTSLLIAVCIVGLALTAELGRDIITARAACESRLPSFEHFAITEVDRTWTPPIIRCVAVDTDETQGGEVYSFGMWALPGLLGLTALDAGAAALVWIRRRRNGESRHQ